MLNLVLIKVYPVTVQGVLWWMFLPDYTVVIFTVQVLKLINFVVVVVYFLKFYRINRILNPIIDFNELRNSNGFNFFCLLWNQLTNLIITLI